MGFSLWHPVGLIRDVNTDGVTSGQLLANDKHGVLRGRGGEQADRAHLHWDGRVRQDDLYAGVPLFVLFTKVAVV